MVDGHPVVKNVYPHQIAFNLLPQIDSFTESGYTKEELKMLNEGRKILSLPDLKVTCTCVRVPVYRSHSISVTAQFEQPVDVETARRAYDGKPGVAVMDNPSEGVWPTPLDSTNGDTCYVGRMRMDMAIDNALTLWVVGDQVQERGSPERRTDCGTSGRPLNYIYYPRPHSLTSCVKNNP